MTLKDYLPDDPPSVPGHGLFYARHWPRHASLHEPAKSFIACTCGHEADSQESAGGGAESCAELWHQHLEEVAA